VTHATQSIIANTKTKKQQPNHYFLYNQKANYCKGEKILSFPYRIPDFDSLAKDDIVSTTLT